MSTPRRVYICGHFTAIPDPIRFDPASLDWNDIESRGWAWRCIGVMVMDELRLALRRLAKAVAVITTRSQGIRYAMSATAISELSFDPPSMLICVNRSASLYAPLTAGARFGINILHHSQEDIAKCCAGHIKGEDRFLQGEWLETETGVPRLAQAQASIICRNVKIVEFGTHAIFIGEVEEVFIHGAAEPLVYLDGRFTQAHDVAPVMSS